MCSGKIRTTINGQVSTEFTAAAVKMNKVSTKEGRDSFLAEIKFMSRVGKHENIVYLLGAHTADMKKGKLVMFLEFCELGTLLDQLRKINATNKQPTQTHSEDGPPPFFTLSMEKLSELHNWSWGVLNGMEYLASKQVETNSSDTHAHSDKSTHLSTINYENALSK